MKNYKWRMALSLLNLAASIALSALGLREYSAFRIALKHSDAIVPYVPTAQLISYCLNAPSFVLSNLLGNTWLWRSLWGERWLGGYWFQRVSVTFYVFLFLFWWFVGSRLDVKPREKERKSLAAVVGWLTGAFGALALLYVGIDLLRTDLPAGRVQGASIPFAMLLWGFALFFYFSAKLLRSLRE
jgi:hypothetical protein